MTLDKVILDMVKGCHITFTHDQFPLQLRPPQSIKFTDWESSLMDQEIYTLLQKGVIEEAYHSCKTAKTVDTRTTDLSLSFTSLLNKQKRERETKIQK